MLDTSALLSQTTPKLTLAPPGEFPHYIDSSMLSAWRSCRRKHFWSVINALYPTGKSIHLTAGGAFAAGMEAARKKLFTSEFPQEVSHLELLEAAYLAFEKEWGDFVAPEGHAKSFVNTFAALDNYLTLYPPLTDVLQPYIRPDGSPAVEYTFAIPLEDCPHPVTNEPMLFVGRFDMLGEYVTASGRVPCIVDEKTTYSMGVGWADSWDLRGQFIGYLWALNQQGLNVRHAAVRGIGIQKTQFPIQTAFPEYSEHLMNRWHRQLIRDVTAMTTAFAHWSNNPSLHEEAYPYNLSDSCQSYGGCAFATLCLAPDQRQANFFTNYIRHVWNPLAKQPIEELAATVKEELPNG